MPSRSLGRQSREYVSAFLWFLVGLAILGLFTGAAHLMPEGNLVIGRYTPVPVTGTWTVVTVAAVTTGVETRVPRSGTIIVKVELDENISGLGYEIKGWPWTYLLVYNELGEGILVVSPSPQGIGIYYRVGKLRGIEIYDRWVLVKTTDDAPPGTLGLQDCEAFGIDDWCELRFYWYYLGPRGYHVGDVTVYVNGIKVYDPTVLITVRTRVPVTYSYVVEGATYVWVPEEGSTVVGNRFLVSLIGLAACVLFFLAAIVRLLRVVV